MKHSTLKGLLAWLRFREAFQGEPLVLTRDSKELRDDAVRALKNPEEQLGIVVGSVQINLSPEAQARIRRRLLQEIEWEKVQLND